MTREEMERIYQEARDTTPEEMRELADLMHYVHERTEKLDGLVEDQYKEGARGVIMMTAAAQYGKDVAAKEGRETKLDDVPIQEYDETVMTIAEDPPEEDDTITIMREDLNGLIKMLLTDLNGMRKDRALLEREHGTTPALYRMDGAMNAAKEVLERLMDIFANAKKDEVIELDVLDIDPDAPKH